VFLVQYWGQIDESVVEQMQLLATAKSFAEGRDIWYGVIDGGDSQKLIEAYPRAFPSQDKLELSPRLQSSDEQPQDPARIRAATSPRHAWPSDPETPRISGPFLQMAAVRLARTHPFCYRP
jgi:hypothetical protein